MKKPFSNKRLCCLKEIDMASPTRKTEKNRKRKIATQGKKRKAAIRTNGTTKSKNELFGDEE